MALGGKFIRLKDQNGGEFLTQPSTWETFEPTQGKDGAGKDTELTLIRFVSGGQRRVLQKQNEVAKLVEQIAV